MAILYDPRYHSFVSWASLLVEQFASNQLEIPTEMTDWKRWGESLAAIDVFSSQGIPSPELYTDWADWAFALINSMNDNA